MARFPIDPEHNGPRADGAAESPTLTEGPEAATEGFGIGEERLLVEQNLGGRYQVVGRLCAGGMGEVWRAFDLKLRVEVALKALRAYYTLSRLWGNYPGLVGSDEQWGPADPLRPNASVRRSPNGTTMFDWPTLMYDANAEPVYGRLATDRTHQLRAQFLYSFDFGLSVGVTQYVASGTPRSELADIFAYPDSSFFPKGGGNLGETPWRTQTDLSLWQRFPLGRLDLSIGLTVLNVFDEDTATR